MGSKNKPGKYDCYDKAEPDEPMFVLLARDPHAPALVRLWADLRGLHAGNPSKVEEARKCAHQMDEWRKVGRPERLNGDQIIEIDGDGNVVAGVPPTGPIRDPGPP